MIHKKNSIEIFPFKKEISASLLICCGGFEKRVRTFIQKLQTGNCVFEHTILFRYAQRNSKDEKNLNWLRGRIFQLTRSNPQIIDVDSEKPQATSENIKSNIASIPKHLGKGVAIIDITGMTHLIAIETIHACILLGFHVNVVYTEADEYYPLKHEAKTLINAWKKHDYRKAEKFLQSAALKSVDILQDFQGNFRPGRPLCLLVFAGYEPNRLEGLVNVYTPGAIIVLYGKSPYRKHRWRLQLSKVLHKDLFSRWLFNERETSTIDITNIQKSLEEVFGIIKDKYDLAITPHCSKMQGVATYLFWRNHPEIQIVFTSPIRFNSNRYSRGSGKTFLYDLKYF